jgi:putative peptide zinc metalloprotease protein
VLIAITLVKSIPFFGALLASAALFGTVVLPSARLLHELWRSGSLGQAIGPGRRLASVATALLAGLFVVPLPLSTTVEGIVIPAEAASVRAGAEGFVVSELAAPGTRVDAGQDLLRLADDETEVRLRLASSRLDEVRARVDAAVRVPRDGEVLRQEVAYLEQQVDEAGERVSSLDVTAPVAGRWFPVHRKGGAGSYFKRGELLGLVIDPGALRLIALVEEADIQLVRDASTGISVRGGDGLHEERPSHVVRLMPEATHRLPHAALTTEGGGRIARNPEAGDSLEAVHRYFWVELDLSQVRSPCPDCRARVRFSHPPEPLAWRLGRWLRRQFMTLLDG